MAKIKDSKKYEIDMVNGPFYRKVLSFAVPLILTSILQLLYNSADTIIIGQFAGKESLAAMGATGPFAALVNQVFLGFSVGASVVVSRAFGAGDKKDISEAAHTSLMLGAILGVIVFALGFVLTRPFLTWMGTPDDIIDKSIIYMKIFFFGAPGFMVYSFGAAVMRAVGDTKRPLYFLIATGILNVFMNLAFVIFLKMDVAGVALATTISQYISSTLVVRCLIKSDAAYGIRIRELHIYKDKLMGIIRVGLPAGLQSALFCISNVLIQSALNGFNSTVIAGVSTSNSAIDYIFACATGFSQAATSFVAANMGAKKYGNVGKLTRICCLLTAVVTGALSAICIVFAPQVVSIFNTDPGVIRYGTQRIRMVFPFYFTYALGDLFVGAMRGFGSVVKPTIVTTLGTCGVRVIWVFTVFKSLQTLPSLHWAHSVSWLITLAAQLILYIFEKKRLVPSELAKI